MDTRTSDRSKTSGRAIGASADCGGIVVLLFVANGSNPQTKPMNKEIAYVRIA
jgi:hypothetical protein